jgi:hypothetical protein
MKERKGACRFYRRNADIFYTMPRISQSFLSWQVPTRNRKIATPFDRDLPVTAPMWYNGIHVTHLAKSPQHRYHRHARSRRHAIVIVPPKSNAYESSTAESSSPHEKESKHEAKPSGDKPINITSPESPSSILCLQQGGQRRRRLLPHPQPPINWHGKNRLGARPIVVSLPVGAGPPHIPEVLPCGHIFVSVHVISVFFPKLLLFSLGRVGTK